MSLEHEVRTLREQVARLHADNTHLAAQVQELLTLAAELRTTIARKDDQIAALTKRIYGRTSERIHGPTLFDDILDEPDSPPPAPPDELDTAESEQVELVPKRKRKGHGRKRNPANLPRQREIVDLSDAEKVCPCCAAMRVRVGETLREQLDYTPASIFVREVAQQTYACRNCEQAGNDPQFATAAVPAEAVPRSGVGAGLLAQVIVSKFVDHLPLYRQESIFARHGWPVSRSRLCDLLAACATLLEPLYRVMITRVKQSFAIHADETPVRLLQPRRNAYAWVYMGDALHPYTLFEVTPGRGEEYPRAFLAGYEGFVHADGFTGYNRVHGGTRHIGCWAHVRRKFVDARANEPAKANAALAYIRTLYAVEKEIAAENLTSDTAVSVRQTRAGPIIKQFGDWLEAERRSMLPKSTFGEAVTYALNLWPTLGRYMHDARLAIDNNVAERAVRPLAVGRRNWLFVGGPGGLRSTSVLLSLCASARRHGLNPWRYLRDVLSAMASKPAELSDLLPDIWAKQHLPTDM